MKYLSLVVRVFQDTVADKTRIRVSEHEVANLCNTLAQDIHQSYEPDLVIAIDTGGSVPGDLIAQAMGIPVMHLTIRRDIDIARRYSLDPIPLRWIMSLYHHYLFQTTMPTISVTSEIDVSGKKVLIVDDSVHTGKTIDVAIDYLKGLCISDVKIAALTYVSKRRPDFSILRTGNYSFPWSKDYK